MVDFTDGHNPFKKPNESWKVVGAPAVGQTMQYRLCSEGEWVNGKVIAYHRGRAWIENLDNDLLPIHRFLQVTFRVKEEMFTYVKQT